MSWAIPLLDWLDLHGTPKGFKRDDELPGYDPRTDFTEFLFAQGRRFEEAVVAHLSTLHPVVTISDGPEDVRALGKAEETFRAMNAGAPIIHQGVLRDPQHRSYGAPDLLVRSDVLAELFPGAIEAEQVAGAAPDLGGPGTTASSTSSSRRSTYRHEASWRTRAHRPPTSSSSTHTTARSVGSKDSSRLPRTSSLEDGSNGRSVGSRAWSASGRCDSRERSRTVSPSRKRRPRPLAGCDASVPRFDVGSAPAADAIGAVPELQ